jgi:isocitrate lyase
MATTRFKPARNRRIDQTVPEAHETVAAPAPSETEWAPPVPATRWAGVVRPYRGEDVERLADRQGRAHARAARSARLWHLLTTREYVNALGALMGTRRCSR